MPSKIFTAALVGLDAAIVEVEAAAGGGDFGQITIVGLPDAAVSEARERVRSALRVCGRPYPRRKITVNLAPADLKKHGPAYDLPIALSILALQNNFKVNLDECLFAGELSLDGGLRPIAGALSLALIAQAKNFKKLFLPSANAAEAKLIKEIEVRPVKNLLQLVNHLSGREEIKPAEETILPPSAPSPAFDLAFIKGQTKAKRALEIAAAGGHNLLLFGPPGAGKTLLAKAFPGLLPPLSRPEMLAVTKIYSASGRLKDSAALVSQRPFRAPHHSASAAAIIGGGSSPRPGEISLAHHGVLFLRMVSQPWGRPGLKTGYLICGAILLDIVPQ